MTENHKPVRVAINVMRARLTVIGFNIAVVSFQINRLFSFSAAGGLKVPGIDHTVHVVADMALFLSLALSIFAILAFIMSSTFDEVGVCTHWSVIAGQLLMFLALAQTTAGFFEPLVTAIETVAAKFPDKASEFHILRSGAIVAGGGAWFLATYGGPINSLMRSPFHRRTNIALGIAYPVVLLVLCWITAQTVRVEAVVSGDEPGLIFSLLRELVQPLRW